MSLSEGSVIQSVIHFYVQLILFLRMMKRRKKKTTKTKIALNTNPRKGSERRKRKDIRIRRQTEENFTDLVTTIKQLYIC